MRTLQRVLLVEDHEPLLAALRRGLSLRPVELLLARSVAEAQVGLLSNPDAVVTDVRLPDGTALDVTRLALQMRPVPLLVAISGEASPEEAFELAGHGVRKYLAKPLSADQLWDALVDARDSAPPLEPLAAACVGHSDIRQVEGKVRQAMLDQALALAGGNLTEAARILRVSRQAVQRQARGRPGGVEE